MQKRGINSGPVNRILLGKENITSYTRLMQLQLNIPPGLLQLQHAKSVEECSCIVSCHCRCSEHPSMVIISKGGRQLDGFHDI